MHPTLRRALCALLLVPCSAMAAVTFDSLVAEMQDRDALARFPVPRYETHQASSYNRLSTARDQADQGTGGWFADSDGTGFIRTETINGQPEWVVMEHTGPGALIRFWTPYFYYDFNNRTGPHIRIYLDGATTPVIDQNFIELLTNNDWPAVPYGAKPANANTLAVPAPFANFTARAGVLHLPVPFAQSCKVTMTAKPFYNIIGYRTYPAGTAVQTFAPADLQSPSLATTGAELLKPAVFTGGTALTQTGPVPTGGEIAVDLPAGANAVRHLQIQLNPADITANPACLRSLVLSVTFDGAETVWVPVGDFFSSPARLNPLATWTRQVDPATGVLTCQWAMPYQTSGRIRLLNVSSTPIQATLTVRTSPWTWDARSMHFHANWRADDVVPGTPFRDWNFIDIRGQGTLVGDSWTVLNLTDGWWGEGDEKIYTDDDYDVAKFPSQFGTGSEDYYGWAGGVNPTRDDEFSAPYHANVEVGSTATNSPRGFNVNTRIRALDATPFEQRLVFDMEASPGTGQRNAWDLLMYSSAVFWYGKPGATSNRPPLPAAAASPATSLTELQVQSDLLKNGGGTVTIAGAIEAESLTPSAATPGVQAAVETPPAAANPALVLSGGRQLRLPFTAPGNFVEFRLTEQFAPRMLRIRLSKSAGFGRVHVWVNGRRVLADVPLTSATLQVADLRLGLFEPQENRFTIRIECAAAGADGGLAAAVDAFVVTAPAPLQAKARIWRLGEDDPGATAGGAGNAATRERSGVLTLAKTGATTYQADVPPGGSTLSVRFPGTAFYTGSGAAYFQDLDFGNFQLSFYAKPTAATSYHVAVALGRYGAGCEFIYLTGTSWRYHVNGQGDMIVGPAGSATLNQWQKVTLTRTDGVCRLKVNDTLLGTSAVFQTPSADFTLGAAKTGSGSPDGRFIGLLDQVRLVTDASYAANLLDQLPITASESDLSPSGDFDGDGACNALEYLCGTSGASSASVPKTSFAMSAAADGTYPGIAIPLDAAAAATVYWEVEESRDLAHWAVLASQATHPNPTAQPHATPGTLRMDQASRGFYRLRIPSPTLLAQALP